VHSWIPNELSLTITLYYKNIEFRQNISTDFATKYAKFRAVEFVFHLLPSRTFNHPSSVNFRVRTHHNQLLSEHTPSYYQNRAVHCAMNSHMEEMKHPVRPEQPLTVP